MCIINSNKPRRVSGAGQAFSGSFDELRKLKSGEVYADPDTGDIKPATDPNRPTYHGKNPTEVAEEAAEEKKMQDIATGPRPTVVSSRVSSLSLSTRRRKLLDKYNSSSGGRKARSRYGYARPAGLSASIPTGAVRRTLGLNKLR